MFISIRVSEDRCPNILLNFQRTIRDLKLGNLNKQDVGNSEANLKKGSYSFAGRL